MTYLDDDAALIRASLPPGTEPPADTDTLFLLYALLLRARGDQVGLADVHDAWSVWMLSSDPSHPALLPFEELPPDKQCEDAPYVEAIREAARRRKSKVRQE